MGIRRTLPIVIAIAIAIVAALGACTFPDVDYADGGEVTSSGTSGGTCAVSTACADDAMMCAAQANKKHNACTHQCKPNNPNCVPKCDADLKSALTACEAICESCAAPDCQSRTTNCGALVGL